MRSASSIAPWIVALFVLSAAYAQEGMERAEFYRKLEAYFDRELIGDLDSVLAPREAVRFYSWDAGDFSGDGNPDLVCVVRRPADKARRLRAYLFVDIDGFLVKIATKEYSFIETPLEVGAVVRYGVCYITEKLRQYEWRIRGYRFDGIALVEVMNYYTRRIGNYTLEQTLNYVRLELAERWLTTHTAAVALERKASIVPLYPRGAVVSHGYVRKATLRTVDYVQKGAFYWSGPADCSLSLWGAYDSNFVYLTLAVRDSDVVVAYCDTCPRDRVELWFDLFDADTALPSRALRRDKRSYQLRLRPDAPQIGLGIELGDFRGKPPTAKLLVTDSSMLTRLRLKALTDVAIAADKDSGGYTLRLRVPWLLLGSTLLPPFQRVRSVGLLTVVHDIDNEFRPEEETIFSSATYQAAVPATFGELLMMPAGEYFGHVEYIYADRITQQLRLRGF